MRWVLASLSVLLAWAMPTFAADRVLGGHYPPMMIADDAERPGYAIEVIAEAARRAGRDIAIEFVPFARALDTLQGEQPLFMAALFAGKKHDEAIVWVTEIQTARLRFASLDRVVDGFDAARTLDSIVVEADTTAHVILEKMNFDNIVVVSSVEASARMLASGRVSAWFQGEQAMRLVWARLDLGSDFVSGKSGADVPVYMAASRSVPEDVVQTYAEQVDGMRRDGTLDRVWRKYSLN